MSIQKEIKITDGPRKGEIWSSFYLNSTVTFFLSNGKTITTRLEKLILVVHTNMETDFSFQTEEGLEGTYDPGRFNGVILIPT